MEYTTPPENALVQRRGTFSSSQYSSTSSSSPEVNTDVVTPDSEDDDRMDLVPKVEELDNDALEEIEDAKPRLGGEAVVELLPRKRGRPRKHPIVEQKKLSHARSKTGCTYRRRLNWTPYVLEIS